MANRIKLHNAIANALGEEFMAFNAKYRNKEWEWKYISINSNITREMIEKHPDKPWDYPFDENTYKDIVDWLERTEKN